MHVHGWHAVQEPAFWLHRCAPLVHSCSGRRAACQPCDKETTSYVHLHPLQSLVEHAWMFGGRIDLGMTFCSLGMSRR